MDSRLELPAPQPPLPRERSLWRAALASVRRSVLAGLMLVLPFFITGWIVYWLYTLIETYVIGPAARVVTRVVEGRPEVEVPEWFSTYAAPPIGVLCILALLYFIGLFARVRIDHVLDAILLRVPIITSIHKAVRQLFKVLSGSTELSRFQRVVLVKFPHPGMKVPGFVTAATRDITTGKTILCIYVPTTPVPTSGYMLLVPEEEVTELDWDLECTIQAVVSFGITAPPTVQYFATDTTLPNTSSHSQQDGTR